MKGLSTNWIACESSERKSARDGVNKKLKQASFLVGIHSSYAVQSFVEMIMAKFVSLLCRSTSLLEDGNGSAR